MKVPPFRLNFEVRFLKNYSRLNDIEQEAIDKTISLLSQNPRHPSLNIHKAKDIKAKYKVGGDDVFIAYSTMNLRVTFEYGPELGMITIRNCGYHNKCEENP